ncbi:hypothetical protein K2D_27980 [Planctomycetes bacterium K2D]|uniref:Uncharacterized protein n=1 Tax=Botrimarina mediterranea TaxID=2528022 RepID=A0A518K9S3_9BACT|nr:hypothetical protein Spa11_27510 [Botrimarina mediterranea]QDV79187.1 hypothetical protein K2D_27980 [Planctomycetes bacterium K2D]
MTRLPTNQWQALKNGQSLPGAGDRDWSWTKLTCWGLLLGGLAAASCWVLAPNGVASAIERAALASTTALRGVGVVTRESPAPTTTPTWREHQLNVEFCEIPPSGPGETPGLWNEILWRTER